MCGEVCRVDGKLAVCTCAGYVMSTHTVQRAGTNRLLKLDMGCIEGFATGAVRQDRLHESWRRRSTTWCCGVERARNSVCQSVSKRPGTIREPSANKQRGREVYRTHKKKKHKSAEKQAWPCRWQTKKQGDKRGREHVDGPAGQASPAEGLRRAVFFVTLRVGGRERKRAMPSTQRRKRWDIRSTNTRGHPRRWMGRAYPAGCDGVSVYGGIMY